METGGGGYSCFFNPRYSDCLKEMLLQSVQSGGEPQRQFDRHACQGPLSADSCAVAIDSGQLAAMRSGWDAGVGPYPAFKVQQRAGPLLTHDNLLTVMRARRLGPLRLRGLPPQPLQALAAHLQPEQGPTHSAREPQQMTAPPDTCLSYRDRKDQQRFAPPVSSRRSLPNLPFSTVPMDSIDRETPQILLQPAAPGPDVDSEAELVSHVNGEHLKSAVGVDMLEPGALSLSFNYNRFRERLARWEEAAEAAVVAAAPVSGSELVRLHRRPAAGLQIRSVVVADRQAGPTSGRGGATMKGRPRRQALSNQQRR